MLKIKSSLLKRIASFTAVIAILIFVPIMFAIRQGNAKTEQTDLILNVWQIDSFEGGRGSRTAHLQKIATEFSESTGCYLMVTSLSSASARLNLEKGNVPDILSYGAGMYGLEKYINGKSPYKTWCYGSYCLLSINAEDDFSGVSSENTVINSGTDNLYGAAALLSGLSGSAVDMPTGAYVKLINGDYKYLLGTQRDAFRLKTRGIAFSLKPITVFNDLYQNISVTAREQHKISYAEKFIDYLISKKSDNVKLGLFADGIKLYDDELSALENLQYDYKLSTPISESMKNEINKDIKNNDVNRLKNILK